MTGFEPLIAGAAVAAANKLAELVIETGWGSGGGVLGRFRTAIDERTKQLVFNASRQYVETYRDRHCLLKVLGMREPVPLESIYTAVRLLDRWDIAQFDSIASLEESYRQRGERRFQQEVENKRKGIVVASAEPFLMVLGQPGAGKSTFLRKMGLEALKRQQDEFQHRCIPVFVELKRFVDRSINLEQFIAAEFETCGFPDSKGFTRQALENGRLLILLDGLDEVPTTNMNSVIVAIHDFVDRYAQNRYIASCRIAAYRASFRRFKDVTMAEFDDEQIQQFIRNWFQSEQDKTANTAAACWETLQRQEHAGAKELAHTPLLLTFLCLVYDRSQNFPDNRSVLYRKALRILLEEWAAEKRLENQRQIYEGLSVELEEILLSELACRSFVANRLFLPQRDIVEKIKAFLAKNLNAPQHLDGEAVLNAIAVQQGILVERAEDVYSFSHLTLQEYLTAQYIDDRRLIKPLVQKCLTDQRWREVFLLVAGVMRGGADEMLRLMEKQAQLYIVFPKIRSLLQWAEETTAKSSVSHKPVAKRVIAIFLACLFQNTNLVFSQELDSIYVHEVDSTYEIAYGLIFSETLTSAYQVAYGLTNMSHSTLSLTYVLKQLNIFQSANLASSITQLKSLICQTPDDEQPIEIHRAFADQIRQIWYGASSFDLNLTGASTEEIEALGNYLYSCDLIVRCKEAAVRVSPQVWAGIEDRMLRVVD